MMVAVLSMLQYGFYIVNTVCAALITINGDSYYFIVNFFRPSGSSKLLLYLWYAALFVVLNGMCVLCCLIVYFVGGQLVIDWDKLQDFLITRSRPIGNKVTNTISYAKVEYHMCKYSAPSPSMHRQEAKCLVLDLNHECHAILIEKCCV